MKYRVEEIFWEKDLFNSKESRALEAGVLGKNWVRLDFP